MYTTQVPTTIKPGIDHWFLLWTGRCLPLSCEKIKTLGDMYCVLASSACIGLIYHNTVALFYGITVVVVAHLDGCRLRMCEWGHHELDGDGWNFTLIGCCGLYLRQMLLLHILYIFINLDHRFRTLHAWANVLYLLANRICIWLWAMLLRERFLWLSVFNGVSPFSMCHCLLVHLHCSAAFFWFGN